MYDQSVQDDLHYLPFIWSFKAFKIWMYGLGPFPNAFQPGLRLEVQWIQYQLIHPMIAMPETMIFDSLHLEEAQRYLERYGTIVLKRILGRGGRGLQRINDSQAFMKSWEAKICFGETETAYLRPNLYEHAVAQTTLQIPASVFDLIRESSIRIEIYYEAFDLFSFPKTRFKR